MGNIWEFLLQTLTVSLTAAVLLIVKYLLADKLSPRWQYGIWGLLALRALIPAGMTRQVLLPLPAWVDMCKTAAERGLASAYAGPWDAMDAKSVLPWPSGAPESVTDWLFVAFALGAAAYLLWKLAAYIRLRLALRRGAPASAELSAQISELQDAVRMGEATVLDWRWLPVDKLHRDADKSWMPVQVQVTPRTTRGGVTARLAVRCGDDTQLYEMTAAPDGSFAADGIVFTVGSTYELSVQWTADGVTTNETLGSVDFNDEMTEPQIIWGAAGSSLDFGYSVRRVGNKQYRLTLTCYPVEVQVDAPPWMQPAQVEIDLRLNGDAGEPTATAVLDCESESSYGNSSRTESVWNGTFYSDDVVNGWEYDGVTLPKYVVRVTDTNGDVWTEEMPLSKR